MTINQVTGRSRPAKVQGLRRGGTPRRAISWWWALPGMVLLILVHFIAVSIGASFSFTDWTGLGSFDFVGLDNFVRAFSDPLVLRSLTNSLLLAAVFLVVTNILGLALAEALNRQLKSRHVLRTLLFAPVVLSPLAVGYLWKFIFQYDGPLNGFVSWAFGPQAVTDWLASPVWALWCIEFVMIWKNLGITMVIYLAGLAGVPPEVEEAAAIDGAGAWRRFVSVVLPYLQPAVVIASTLMLIYGLRVFDEVIALTGGGPFGRTETLSTQIYKQTFVASRFGFGSALSLILTIVITLLAVVQNLVVNRAGRRGRA